MQPGIIGVLLQLCLEVVHLRLLFLLLPQQVLPAGIVLETLRCAVPRFFVGGLRGFLRILGIGHILLQGGFTAADLLEGGFGGLQRGLGGFQLGTQLGAGKLQRLQLGIFYRGKMGTGVIFTGIVAIAQIYHVIVLGQHGLNGLDLRRGEGGAEGGLILGIGQLLGSGHQLGIGGLHRDDAHAQVLRKRTLGRQAVARTDGPARYVVANPLVEIVVKALLATGVKVVVKHLTLSILCN